MINKFTVTALTLAGLVAALPAQAANCTGINLGTSQTSDFTLGGVDSSACVISGENPDQGPDGNSSGFSPDPFSMGWTLLTKINGGSSPTLFDGVSFSWSLTSAGQSGTWTFGADQAVKLDLVIAMHASNHSGAFLFEDLTLTADQVQNGTWQIKWVNNGGQNPDYSNSSLWVRDVTPVPEPETYALLLAGLGIVGFMARRRKSA
jgi:hypothetical protein